MNNINLINKKKKFQEKITSHGDIIGNRDFQLVEPQIEKKFMRPTKRVGFKNGEESKEVNKVGRKPVPTPHQRPVRGDDTILNPKPLSADPNAAQKPRRQYPKPEPKRDDSRRKYMPSRDLPKDHWVFDPETSTKYLTSPRGKKLDVSPRVERNVLTGHSSNPKDVNGLGILPSVGFTKTGGIVNSVKAAKRVSGFGNRSSVSHNILQWG